MPRLILLLAIGSALLSSPLARAWSAADPPGQSDDSVCHFGSYAIKWIQEKLLNGQPAAPDTFASAAAKHAATHCRVGQVLILQDPWGSEDAPGVFNRIVSKMCNRSDLQTKREPKGAAELKYQSLEWRCPIIKFE